MNAHSNDNNLGTDSMSVGEALVKILEANDVDTVFGIPGVHTVALYRGIAASPIKHVTPRHEQGAGFMADGYARKTGKPGVCLLITGPGLTNAITAMQQAAADSIPMLVITGVNARATLGHGYGKLHELPDQRALTKTITRYSHTLLDPADLENVMTRAFAELRSGRPGPVHIEIPTDVMDAPVSMPAANKIKPMRPRASADLLNQLADAIEEAQKPLLLLGGGAVGAAKDVSLLADRLSAPAITTINARGILGGNSLEVPASPSLPAPREMIRDADLVIAIGTEFGPTDYDMYVDGDFPQINNLARIDICPHQLARGPRPRFAIQADAGEAITDLLAWLPDADESTREKALAWVEEICGKTLAELPDKLHREIEFLDRIRRALPEVTIVGDSTQPIYAGNLWHATDKPISWFNSATGFGTLGYAIPAAIGAAVGLEAMGKASPLLCLTGDGGAQFTLPEIGAAADLGLPVIFVVWNNDGYQEIENYMIETGVTPEGVKPSAPDFCQIAEAYGLISEKLEEAKELEAVLSRLHAQAVAAQKPALLEVAERVIHS